MIKNQLTGIALLVPQLEVRVFSDGRRKSIYVIDSWFPAWAGRKTRVHLMAGKTPAFIWYYNMSEQTSVPMAISSDNIRDRIYTIRGVQVMLDSDLAELYHVETRRINESVKRNPKRFPSGFCFELTQEEYEALSLKSQNATSNGRGGRRKLPKVFSEQGVAMLSAVLSSDYALEVSISIMNAFVAMRHYLADNAIVFQRLDRIELKQLETDENIKQIFKQLEAPKQDKAVIFFKGQIWDATSCIEEIIGKAGQSIILIDSYVDKGTLDMLSRKKAGVAVSIHTTQKNCKLTEKEISTFKSQYGKLEIKFTDEFHDRFLILDNKSLYHIGASIKDAGKKAFEISLNEDEKLLKSLLERL